MSDAGPSPGWPRWATPLSCLVLAAVWTWPAVLGTELLGHHPDAPGTAWFISAAPRLLGDLSDPLTGWPVGARYGRPDSFLLMVVGTLGAPLGAVRVLGWATVLGVAVSAWAAESVARQLGARAPWSLLAGLGFAFSGLAATAHLEGYPYHLMNPWLPLFVGSWLRATRPGGRPRDGGAAAVWFVLALLDTAWLGIACVPVGVAFLLAALPRRDRDWLRPLVAAVAVATPLVLAYVWLFRAGGTAGADALADAGFPTPDLGLSLRRFALPGPSIDLHGYTQSATLPAVVLALAVVSHRYVPRSVPRRTLLGAGLASLGLALLPAAVPPLTRSLAALDDTVVSVVASSLLRFPDRLTWGTLACLSVLAAVALTGLADKRPRVAASVLGLALLDAFVGPRLPARQQRMVTGVPSAYAAHTGPVLDLWPEDASPAPAWTLWTTNLGCYYQAHHGRPVADLCIVSPGVDSPRLTLQRWVLDHWLSGRVDETVPVLQELGFGSVAVHVSVMSASDRQRVDVALADWPALVRTTDGGEELVAAAVPDARVQTHAAATAAWTRLDLP